VIEAGGAGGGWTAAEGLPGVEADVMVVAAGGEEGCGVSEAGGDVKAEDAVVEVEGALEVGDLEMDVAYLDARRNGRDGHDVWMMWGGGGRNCSLSQRPPLGI
jgi:hypothetical protein